MAKNGADACERAYDGWWDDPGQDAFDEQQAYKASVECLNKLTDEKCCYKNAKHGSGTTDDCCAKLQEELLESIWMYIELGKTAQEKPCPFTDSGDIK
ncbi:MAG: hypothetical protein JW741_13565 [Sedimentisphaerales bacterium]|nr:hypothetical protein [Sedimentisphaerales bacterium]